MVNYGVLALLLLLLVGCSSAPLRFVDQSASLQQCQDQLVWLDRQIARHGVADAQSSRIEGFPFMRSNRFWASFANEPLKGESLFQWLTALQQLDLDARQFELKNLPAEVKTVLHQRLSNPIQYLRTCSEQSLLMLQRDPQALAKLRERVAVADNYQSSLRWLGLYPLSSLFVEKAIADYQQQVVQRYAEPFATLHDSSLLQRYQPTSKRPLRAPLLELLIDQLHANPLGVPLPTPILAESLFEHFSPIWEIESIDQNDQLGSPSWQDERIVIDTQQPHSYRYLSHSRFGDETLLQLNYVVWFPARPGDDIYAGELDGITWRVTLDQKGEPLLYDVMHNCGCYHKLYPTQQLIVRDEVQRWREPPLIPQLAPELQSDQRMVIRISSGKHYVERLYADQPSGKMINSVDYDQLRSLVLGNGESRSLFGDDGLITQSRRAERWLLWPMGIPSAGAMRQAGNHAIAFVGRRHFDDVNLLDSVFELQD